MNPSIKYPLLLLPKNGLDTSKYKDNNQYLNVTIMHGDYFLFTGPANVKFVDANDDLPSLLSKIQDDDINFDNTQTNKYPDYTFGQRLFSTVVESPNPENFTFETVDELDELLSPVDANETITQDWHDNTALVQLLSPPEDRDAPKQRRTIIFSGVDASHGQTIQKINMHDPSMQCRSVEQGQADAQCADPSKSIKNAKIYQCDHCQQIFNDIQSFKHHTVSNHRQLRKRTRTHVNETILTKTSKEEIVNECYSCKKSFKTIEKYASHMDGHGNPDRECATCHRVLSSKSSLRNHHKTHTRRHPCKYCTKSFNKKNALETHVAKSHKDNTCNKCKVTCDSFKELNEHGSQHVTIPDMDFQSLQSLLQVPENVLGFDFPFISNEEVIETNNEGELNLFENEDLDILTLDDPCGLDSSDAYNLGDAAAADCVDNFEDISAEDILNSFGINVGGNDSQSTSMTATLETTSTNVKCAKKYSKVCMICGKGFDRKSDLKRHTIEHVVKRMLSRNPVNKDGRLHLECDLCHNQTYTEIDKFKAHLRTHANLTIYECKFCNKSFSDSSNFSKHKKVHSKSYLQCDLCNRKFNSKTMIARHMEYHAKTPPLVCSICSKVYHFESTFKKHMRFSHAMTPRSKYRCKVCDSSFVSLRHKWDHEWNIHKIRKSVVDCTICGSKFRKFTDLKRHSNAAHNFSIPSSKNYYSGSHLDFNEKIELE